MNRKDKVECWSILALSKNDYSPLVPILNEVQHMDHFLGIVPMHEIGKGGLLLFDDETARNNAFDKIKDYSSPELQITAGFKSAYVESKYLKRGNA